MIYQDNRCNNCLGLGIIYNIWLLVLVLSFDRGRVLSLIILVLVGVYLALLLVLFLDQHPDLGAVIRL